MPENAWIEPPPSDVADPSVTGAFVRGTRPLGRSTVLPRIDRTDDGCALLLPKEARFHQEGEIGTSGLAVTLSARDLDLGRQVAIRFLSDKVRSQKAVLRFAEEARTLGLLDHPNIATVHDVGVDETGNAYLVVRHAKSEESMQDVLDRLRAGDQATHAAWPHSRRLAAFRRVLQALAFAHQQGVVHRDLKPEHIRLGRHHEVQVGGWTCAHRPQMGNPDGLKGADPLAEHLITTDIGVLVGTVPYMSPEQTLAKPPAPASDIYTLGVVLYEWLTLTHYLGDRFDLDELLDGVRTVEPTPPAQVAAPHQARVAAEISWMVCKALAKRPEDRFPSVEAWLAHLDRLAVGDIDVQCAATFQKHWLGRLSMSVDQNPWIGPAALGGSVVVMVALLLAALGMGFTIGVVLL